MHAASLITPARALRENAREVARLGAEHEELFLLLTTLRAASAESLCSLYFDARLERRGRATAFRTLGELVERGLLALQKVLLSRSVYRLTTAALEVSERVRARVSDTFRKPMREDVAAYCWLRARIWAELKELGYEVGRGKDEQHAMRRFLVDAQREVVAVQKGSAQDAAVRVLDAIRKDRSLIPLFRSRCRACGIEGALHTALKACPRCKGAVEHRASARRFECNKCGHASDRNEPEHENGHDPSRRCNAAMRETDHLAYDVAWKMNEDAYDVVLIFVDDPRKDLTEQLRAMPIRIARQPRVPIVLRTTDPHSVFHRGDADWVSRGERHRALLRAFSEDGDGKAFPFATTTRVVDFRPEIQLRSLSRKANPDA